MKPNLIRQRLGRGESARGPHDHGIRNTGHRQNHGVGGPGFRVARTWNTAVAISGAFAIYWPGSRARQCTPVVRVPATEYHFIARVMDAGAQGVMVPNVRSVEQAQRVITALRFAPDGDRGLGLGGAQNDYMRPQPVEYMTEANQSNIFLCQIESTKALAGIDAHCVSTRSRQSVGRPLRFEPIDGDRGAARKSRFCGCPAQGDRRRQAARQERGHSACQPWSRLVKWMGLGFNVISYSADHGVYSAALKADTAAIRGM